MRAATIFLLGCLGVATAAHATPGNTLYAQDSNLNVHEAPSASAPVVMQLDRGRKLVEIKREGSWVKVGIYRIGTSGDPSGFIGNDGWDPAASFEESCRIITKTGDLIRRRLNGVAPAAYRFVTSEAVSCTATSPSRSRLVVSLGAGDNVTSQQIHGYTSRTRRYSSARVWTSNFRELYRRARRRARSN